MPNNNPAVAAKPTKSIFDPFNSSSTGHQRADNRLTGSTSWRESRSRKLQNQFSADAGGGKRVSDTVGAGSLNFGLDGRTANGQFERGAQGLRTNGQRSLWESMRVAKPCGGADAIAKQPLAKSENPSQGASGERTEIVNPFTPFRYGNGRVRETSWTAHEASPSELLDPLSPTGFSENDYSRSPSSHGRTDDATSKVDTVELHQSKLPQIFSNLTFYVNGSTAPWSDHQIKRLLSGHGGRVSVALGRRSVTHVILGKSNGTGGSGGGLAGSKIQKEIKRIGGKAVRFVTADWITDSIKEGKRQPESKYEALKLAPRGVGNVASMFKPKDG